MSVQSLRITILIFPHSWFLVLHDWVIDKLRKVVENSLQLAFAEKRVCILLIVACFTPLPIELYLKVYFTFLPPLFDMLMNFIKRNRRIVVHDNVRQLWRPNRIVLLYWVFLRLFFKRHLTDLRLLLFWLLIFELMNQFFLLMILLFYNIIPWWNVFVITLSLGLIWNIVITFYF
jgi:hypothetical protein